MSAKSDLVTTIEACWNEVRHELEGLNPATPVYPDPLWAIRDVLAHCAYWNDATVAVIDAFRRGEAHATATDTASVGDESDGLNQRVVEAARALSDADVCQRWVAAQDRLTDAVRSLDESALEQQVLAPWSQMMSIDVMVRDELGHDTGHVQDIITAASAQETM
jgi:hypothetical protein